MLVRSAELREVSRAAEPRMEHKGDKEVNTVDTNKPNLWKMFQKG